MWARGSRKDTKIFLCGRYVQGTATRNIIQFCIGKTVIASGYRYQTILYTVLAYESYCLKSTRYFRFNRYLFFIFRENELKNYIIRQFFLTHD